jgi:hypothetical protein
VTNIEPRRHSSAATLVYGGRGTITHEDMPSMFWVTSNGREELATRERADGLYRAAKARCASLGSTFKHLGRVNAFASIKDDHSPKNRDRGAHIAR